MLRDKVALERAKRQEAIAKRNVEIGRVVYTRNGPHVTEMWCDGDAIVRLQQQCASVKVQREELERQKKDLTKLFRRAKADNLKHKQAAAKAAAKAAAEAAAGDIMEITTGMSSMNGVVPKNEPIDKNASEALEAADGKTRQESNVKVVSSMQPPAKTVADIHAKHKKNIRGGTAAAAAVAAAADAEQAEQQWLQLVEKEETIRLALVGAKRRDQRLKEEAQQLKKRKKMHLLDIKASNIVFFCDFLFSLDRWRNVFLLFHTYNGIFFLFDFFSAQPTLRNQGFLAGRHLLIIDTCYWICLGVEDFRKSGKLSTCGNSAM